MAITFPRELPNLDDIAQINTRKKSVVGVFEGLFSGIQKVQKHPHQRWEVEYTIIPLNRRDMDVWWAWLISLNGREKTFYGVLQAPNEMKGDAQNYAAPLLRGAHAARVGALNLQTGPTSVLNYIRAGDYVQLGSSSDARLHMALEDAHTDSSGNTGFDIWPDTYTAYAAGATVTVLRPKGLFRLVDNSSEILQDATNTRKGLRFSAIGVV